ncbi:MAG: pyruvate ferredoxin oxidoreductase [Peptococcaceae bacterium]|nr:pyruvate ferredoxin oxidoreductase [Peptococcaceae bacterium]
MARDYLTGAVAAAMGAARARVQVVATFPITPQTATVETLSRLVEEGALAARMIHVEGEHSAISAAAGAALVGARAFTATSSQGLALMHEGLVWTAGLRLPVVMTVATRALASPVTIFADHQDALLERDDGWTMWFAGNAQEALDFVLLAYRVAEDPRVRLPAMVCFDGFSVSHTSEGVEVPSPEAADAFLPSLVPGPILDLNAPKIFNVMAFPEFFPEFQKDKHESQLAAEKVALDAMAGFRKLFGREYAPVTAYRTEDAGIILVGMGSMTGTVRDAVDRARERGLRVGSLEIALYRPFPRKELMRLLGGASAVGVLDRDLAPGLGGILHAEVLSAIYPMDRRPRTGSFILGLGGRDITVESIDWVLREMVSPGKDGPVFVDENSRLLAAWGLE